MDRLVVSLGRNRVVEQCVWLSIEILVKEIKHGKGKA